MRPSPSSSTTQPFTKAVWGSRSQTYRFPEKSFSPSIPLTTSMLFRKSSVFIKDGAKVAEFGVAFLEESRRCLGPLLVVVGCKAVLMDALDCVLVCAGPVFMLDKGACEGKRADFGLPDPVDPVRPGEGPGEGVGELPILAKGLRR